MHLYAWILFNVFVVILLLLDLGVFHKGSRTIGVKESLIWSAVWIIVALLFNAGVWFWSGPQKGLEFFTCYLIERSLSIDNIFVFVLLFNYFKVHSEYQYKVLFWGIVGAMVMRAFFILAGTALIAKFHWTIYIFGALLVYVGIKLAFQKDEEVHPEKNPVLILSRKLFPVSPWQNNDKFFIKDAGKLLVTPLFLVLLVVESTDVVFAIDSIPAALAITLDSFIVYSSNILAILGLRAMYFALAGSMQMFRFLNYGLSVVLSFVGVKMLLTDFYKISIGASLGFIAVVLTVSIVVSLMFKTPPESERVSK
ncbi:MAG: TerC family protein [Elusimicrobiota bacterium]